MCDASVEDTACLVVCDLKEHQLATSKWIKKLQRHRSNHSAEEASITFRIIVLAYVNVRFLTSST